MHPSNSALELSEMVLQSLGLYLKSLQPIFRFLSVSSSSASTYPYFSRYPKVFTTTQNSPTGPLIPSFIGLSSQSELSCPLVLSLPSSFSWPSFRCHYTVLEECSWVDPRFSSCGASWNCKDPSCLWPFTDSPSAPLPVSFPMPTGQEAEGQELRGLAQKGTVTER